MERGRRGRCAEHHFEAIAKWAHSIGLEYRAQPYGLGTDSMRAAAILDVPEGGSLGFENLDDYRVLADGRDMAGREILSCEAGAHQGGAHNSTWEKLLTAARTTTPAGTSVRVLPAEGLKDGRVDQPISNVGTPIWDECTTRSSRPETWHPR